MVRTIEFYCAILALATAVVSAPVGYEVSTLTPKQPVYSKGVAPGGSAQPPVPNQTISDVIVDDEPMESPEDEIFTEDPAFSKPPTDSVEEEITPDSPVSQIPEGPGTESHLNEGEDYENLERMPEFTEDPVEEIIPDSPVSQTPEEPESENPLSENIEKMPESFENAVAGGGSGSVAKPKKNAYATDDFPSGELPPTGETITSPTGPGSADFDFDTEPSPSTPIYDEDVTNESFPEEDLIDSPSGPENVEDLEGKELYDPANDNPVAEETVTETTETTETTNSDHDDDGFTLDGNDNYYEVSREDHNTSGGEEDDEYSTKPKRNIECTNIDENDTSGIKMGVSGSLRLGGVDLMNLNLGGRLFGENGMAEARGSAGLMDGDLVNIGAGGNVLGKNMVEKCIQGSMLGRKGDEFVRFKKSLHAMGDDGLGGIKAETDINGDSIAAGVDGSAAGNEGVAGFGGKFKFGEIDNEGRVGAITKGKIFDVKADLMQKYAVDKEDDDDEDEEDSDEGEEDSDGDEHGDY